MRVQTSALVGVDAIAVAVEVAVRSGTPKFIIIGLGDNAIKESRERVCTALASSGFAVPDQILVNLAPADLRKEGASFDLAIAMGILAATGQIPALATTRGIFFGELSLDGSLKPIRGAAACVAEAKKANVGSVLLPAENINEAKLIEGVDCFGFRTLREVHAFLVFGEVPVHLSVPVRETSNRLEPKLLSEVSGQAQAKRALIVAAAGGHNVVMIGPPGCGKTMLAERFAELLPPLTPDEMLECVKVHSVCGLPIQNILSGQRPFRHPHYIISDAGLVGGSNPPRPGEITLAHNGVLFLDEFPEYKRSSLEALRIPLERGTVTIARARQSTTFPARFQLLAAMNPCPCGKLGTSSEGSEGCKCPRATVGWYLRKLSQPILDRIDLHVELSAVPLSTIANDVVNRDEGSHAEVTRSIANSHALQRDRNRGELNAFATQTRMKKVSNIAPRALELLERASEKLGLSARGYMRMLRVARTIADLETSSGVTAAHVAEAVGFRGLERLRRYADSAI